MFGDPCVGGTTPVLPVDAPAYPEGVSPFGPYDMAGNATEWVWDTYGHCYYCHSPGVPDIDCDAPCDNAVLHDPLGPPKTNPNADTVRRGGGWRRFSLFLPSYVREYVGPSATTDYGGFRCTYQECPAPCPENEHCVAGQCICAPNCTGKDCGDDGCGGSCGDCTEHYDCQSGTCAYIPWCGDGSCDLDEDCSACPADCGNCCGNAVCDAQYEEDCATCPADCGNCCGNGLCDPEQEEDCATCPADCGCGCGEECELGACAFTACDGKECGDDGCGGWCWTCGAGEYCHAGKCGPSCPGTVCEDGQTRPCGIYSGVCTEGVQTCEGNAWGACIGAIEPGFMDFCDGIDNDCSGSVDENCECVVGQARNCGQSLGICVQGTQICTEQGIWSNCIGSSGPFPEGNPPVCDGQDNDCDGEIDEGCECPE